MKTVFLFIPHYVYTTDLLKTEYVKYLSAKYRVIVFLPFKNNEIERHNYYSNNNIVYISWHMQFKKLARNFRMLRVATVREFDYVSTMKSITDRFYREGSRRIKILNVISLILKKIGIVIKAGFYTKLERVLMPSSKLFNQYYNKYSPSLILTASPGFSDMEAEFIILAKKKKIPTAAVDFSWDNLSSNAVRIRKTDYLIVWNNIVKKEAMEINKYKEDKIFVSGITRFDYYFKGNIELSREDFLKSKGLDPKLKTLFVSTVAPGVFNKFPEIIEELLGFINKGLVKEEVNVFVRLHPKDSRERYNRFNNIKNLHIESASRKKQATATAGFKTEMDKKDLQNLKYTLMYCDLNINLASTISVESFIFDMPVINFCFYKSHYKFYNSHKHYKPIVDSGALKVAYDENDFINYINLYLRDPSIDRENRKKIVENYILPADGYAYKRSVDFLENIIK